ncbi:4-hydroxy-tetrahydrodipicolinate synthase [Veillonella sp. VA137]|uniref:4-hydroxy-tetrahydrodipicolinate synthase n=1 Tax=Veillonella sp. VA137 TaxID=741828 RepID=UPI000F8D5BF7|nr:4-hydroxy-tetrahydrodipicolinate synthase [Veillonella sp. VA137]
MKTFGNILTAMITPFTDDGHINFQEALRLAGYLLDNGSDGLIVCGTTGEGPNIDDRDKLELFTLIAKEYGHRATIIANTGSNSTKKSIALTKAASHTGVHAVMAVVPYYNKPNQEGCYLHFKAIADSTDLPVMLYNVPGRTGGRIEPKTVARLAKECTNITSIKEATGDIKIIQQIRELLPNNDFMIYSGDDALTLDVIQNGGVGVISVSSHIVGKEMQKMIALFKEGKVKEARAIELSIVPILKAMFITTNPIPVKYAMKQLGFSTGPLLLPLCDPSVEEAQIIDAAIESYKQ